MRWLALAGALVLAACARMPDEAALARHRNLGKAYYENPTTKAEAVREFQAALRVSPDSTREKLNYGLALLRVEGREAEAVKALEAVQRRDPSLPHTWFNLGIYYKRRGDAKRAMAQFEGMVAKAPDEAVGHFQLGQLYRQAGREGEARREFEKAAALDPQFAAARFQLYSLTHAANYLADFQRIQAVQKAWVVAEDPSWSSYAEIYDPPAVGAVWQAKPPVSPGLGDFDNDGQMDLCVLTADGPVLYRNVGGKYVRQAAKLPARRFDAAVWIDYDHDYDLDLLLLGPEPALMRNQGAAGWSDQTADFPFVKGNVTDARKLRVDADGKGFDVAVFYRDHAPVLYRDLLGGRYKVEGLHETPADNGAGTPGNWIGIQLKGVRSLKLAQDALVEIKAGTLYRRALYDGTPLTFDLGEHTAADVVRITWPNGLIQNEVGQAGKQTHVIEEAQRLSGSCPMIWSWDGHGFRFVTDVLGVAPLGARSADGFFPTDHQEYVQIPAIAEKDGRYEIRITEELSEVSYLDQVQLYAVDHPAGVDVVTNERFKSPPFPEFRVYGVRGRVYPKMAREDGRDVLASLLARDQRYPDGFARSETGIAELHTLELDFGAAAPDNALLVLNGWVDWPDGSTFRKASQESKAGLAMPYLQVQDAGGAWRTVDADMGMPAGKPKTMGVPVRFLSASRKVRIVTNLCVYWDEAFLSAAEAGPAMRPLALVSAELRYRGFSKARIDWQRKQPDTFFYGWVEPASFWNATPGLYTKFGAVEPLLGEVDDRFVIMGSGDELGLAFGAVAPPRAGWVREFVLKVDGWAKDRDANTAFGNSVEPLPFHGMSRYPYPAGERYPRDLVHEEYRRAWNVRPARAVIAPIN